MSEWVEVPALNRQWECAVCARVIKVGERAFGNVRFKIVQCPGCRAEVERAERARAAFDGLSERAVDWTPGLEWDVLVDQRGRIAWGLQAAAAAYSAGTMDQLRVARAVGTSALL